MDEMWDFLFVIFLWFICDFLLAIFVWKLFRLIPFACCGFSSSLFCIHAHAMGFHAYFSAPTPSFRSGTYRLASGVGFSACFSSPTPTPWVFPPTFLLTHPSQYIRQKKLCIFCDKIMYPIYETTHICYIKHNSFIEFKRIVFHTENLFYNPDFHPSTQTTFYRVVWQFHMFSY